MKKKINCDFFDHCRIADEKTCDPKNCIHVQLNNFPGICSYCKKGKGVKPTGDTEKPFVCPDCIIAHGLNFSEFEKQKLILPTAQTA